MVIGSLRISVLEPLGRSERHIIVIRDARCGAGAGVDTLSATGVDRVYWVIADIGVEIGLILISDRIDLQEAGFCLRRPDKRIAHAIDEHRAQTCGFHPIPHATHRIPLFDKRETSSSDGTNLDPAQVCSQATNALSPNLWRIKVDSQVRRLALSPGRPRPGSPRSGRGRDNRGRRRSAGSGRSPSRRRRASRCRRGRSPRRGG